MFSLGSSATSRQSCYIAVIAGSSLLRKRCKSSVSSRSLKPTKIAAPTMRLRNSKDQRVVLVQLVIESAILQFYLHRHRQLIPCLRTDADGRGF